MTKIPPSCSPVNARDQLELVLAEADKALRRQITARFSELLSAIVRHVLGRSYHQRREQIPERLRREGRCCRCFSTRSQRFSRNGFRNRHLMTSLGELHIDLPRVICECGGSVQIEFDPLLRPYQRIWDDVDAQITRWAGMALSLREMQRELAHLHMSPLALRTLTKRLHSLQELGSQPDANKVPPVLQVDAIWITQLRPNGQVRRDRKGRKRPVKGRFKRPLFIAMGIWPDTGQAHILSWQLGESEEAQDWIAFLGSLEAQGIRGDNGLRLIIHDGGSGLCAALDMVYFDAAQQRCLFHKLRNIYSAIHADEDLSPKQRKRQRKAIFREFQAIYKARRYKTMLCRYLKTIRKYRRSQPKAVATLRRDFRSTITYYHLEQDFPSWGRKHLRTTSRLERFNETLRKRTRSAGAYHSDTGILAMIAQEVGKFSAAQG